jgi:predicted nuclease of predicted toxin-antitoxin system
MSRKHYASKTDAQPDPVFFVDRSLGSRKVVDALRGAGARVESHADHFAPDAPDEDWLTVAGSRGWIVLTKDSLRERPNEMQAVAAANLRVFILTRRNLSGNEMATLFVTHLAAMIRVARREPSPFVATLGGRGVRVIRRAGGFRA